MSEEMYIDGILAQDYGTPYSISFYSKNYNLNSGETINMSEEEKSIEYVINNFNQYIEVIEESSFITSTRKEMIKNLKAIKERLEREWFNE